MFKKIENISFQRSFLLVIIYISFSDCLSFLFFKYCKLKKHFYTYPHYRCQRNCNGEFLIFNLCIFSIVKRHEPQGYVALYKYSIIIIFKITKIVRAF